MVCVSSKVDRMQRGGGGGGAQSTEEHKACCVCLLRCTCDKMMWRVYEIKKVCPEQVKHKTQKKQILKILTH